jgi:hypothetical protein
MSSRLATVVLNLDIRGRIAASESGRANQDVSSCAGRVDVVCMNSTHSWGRNALRTPHVVGRTGRTRTSYLAFEAPETSDTQPRALEGSMLEHLSVYHPFVYCRPCSATTSPIDARVPACRASRSVY